MTSSSGYILIFQTTHHTLLGEKVLQSADIIYQTVPKPRQVVSTCGMALRIEGQDKNEALDLFQREDLKVTVVEA